MFYPYKQHPLKTFIGKLKKGFDWLGYQINEGLGVTIGYKSTMNNDSGSNDMQMNNFMISITSGWHRLIEGANRLSNGG